MSDDEDDYLSEKFLQQITSKSSSSTSKTYSQRRKEAQKQSEFRNLAGRIKSRKEIEEEEKEALKDGLATSLFEREKLAEAEGIGGSKGFKMMSKMGFKPGQTLGRQNNEDESRTSNATVTDSAAGASSTAQTTKRAVPVAINFWEGRKGLGAMKRPLSPSSRVAELERAAKVARVEEDVSKDGFISRARVEYEERRDTGRLSSAQKTCGGLDEKAGIQFNILTLNPYNPMSFPPALLDRLEIHVQEETDDTYRSAARTSRRRDNHERLESDDLGGDGETILARRLREQMQRDALVPLGKESLIDDFDGPIGMKSSDTKRAAITSNDESNISITNEIVEEARGFLELPVRERLDKVLRYMREKYFFCFWCGTEYENQEAMDTSCPGEDEEMHD